jgi:hypothetical protein
MSIPTTTAVATMRASGGKIPRRNNTAINSSLSRNELFLMYYTPAAVSTLPSLLP